MKARPNPGQTISLIFSFTVFYMFKALAIDKFLKLTKIS